MNAILSLAVVAALCIGGTYSQPAGGNANNASPLAQEVQYLRRNLTALWKVVRSLQAQVGSSHTAHGSGSGTHSITLADHLDAARANPNSQRNVHVHSHDGHLHYHESLPDGTVHSHSQHAHRHGDHYHFHEDRVHQVGGQAPQKSAEVDDDDLDDTLDILGEATN